MGTFRRHGRGSIASIGLRHDAVTAAVTKYHMSRRIKKRGSFERPDALVNAFVDREYPGNTSLAPVSRRPALSRDSNLYAPMWLR